MKSKQGLFVGCLSGDVMSVTKFEEVGPSEDYRGVNILEGFVFRVHSHTRNTLSIAKRPFQKIKAHQHFVNQSVVMLTCKEN